MSLAGVLDEVHHLTLMSELKHVQSFQNVAIFSKCNYIDLINYHVFDK